MKTAFSPAVDAETRLLVLGSLPGERSIAAQEYYAHPTNGFWWLIGEVLGERDLQLLPYARRLERLKVHHVGLWDVIATARRVGSLDTAIRDAAHRDLINFAEQLPQLKAIAFNGKAASSRGRKQLAGAIDRWTIIDLPSSSAAYASMPRSKKLMVWQQVEKHLR